LKARKPSKVNSAFAKDFTPEEESPQPRVADNRFIAFPFTDTGNAERLVSIYGRDIHYCPSIGWLVWDGTKWKRDEKSEVSQLAKQATIIMREQAKSIADDELRRKAMGHIRSTGSRRSREAMIALAQSERGVPITSEELDADPYALNVLNGTI